MYIFLHFFEANTVRNVTPKVEYSVFLPNFWPGKWILYYNNVSFAPKTFGKRFLDKIDNSVKNLVLLTWFDPVWTSYTQVSDVCESVTFSISRSHLEQNFEKIISRNVSLHDIDTVVRV